MKITELIAANDRTAFSFEVLPPLKGTGIGTLTRTIDKLREFAPSYINITTHRSEYVYKDLGDGLMQRSRLRRRPGTVAVAAAIQLLLRGDKARDDASFKPTPGGYAHTTELQAQINRFNAGFFDDGTPIKVPGEPFSYGVACYPEKHEEAPNMGTDLHWFQQKVAAGAEYSVTQLFYDNTKYFAFVAAARQAGITVPIIPGIKPLTKRSQLTVVPKVFHCDLPERSAQMQNRRRGGTSRKRMDHRTVPRVDESRRTEPSFLHSLSG